MDRYTQMQVFKAVVEEEGFAAAARKLSMSPPAVTRAVAELETRLGVKLLNRTTRYVKATDAGRRFLEDTRRILEDVQEAEESAAGINATPSGQLNVTAPVLFGKLYVLPVILEYLGRYPDMTVNAVYLDRVVNLLEEGLDVGIRIGNLPDSSIRALRVGSVKQVVCASPAYLEKYGTPNSPKELTDHLVVISSSVSPNPTWKFAKNESVRVKPKLILNNNEAVIEAITNGFGISRLLSYQVARQLDKGLLVPLFENYEPEISPVHIVHRESRSGSAKVRSFVDMIAETLRADKSLI